MTARSHRQLLLLVLLVAFFGPAIGLTVLLESPSLTQAGQARYDYDALGRLVRVIDEQGKVTEYVYDAVGNLVEIVTSASAQAPTITAITPNAIRRGESKQVQVTGTGLNAVTVTNADPGLSIGSLQSSPTKVSFALSVSKSATLGAQPVTFANSAGTATGTITITPELPQVFVAPAPLAIPPDGVQRQFTIRLSHADVLPHNFGLSVSDSTVATVSPASLAIPAGQTEVKATIAGLKGGQTIITLASTTLGNTLVPVFVTAEFKGISTSHAALLGVVLEQPSAPKPPVTIDPVLSPSLGVAFGSYIQGINPKTLTIGTGPTAVVISGAGLGASTSVNIVPADGLTLGTMTVSPDGQSVTVPVTVAANAPTTLRQVVLTTSGGRYVPANPDADRLLITLQKPEITSVEPLFGTPGSTVPFIVRGRYLQGALSVNFSPSTGIAVGSSPAISADGTQLTTTITLSPLAPVGQRAVTATTQGGVSDAAPSSANTFTVVNEIKETFTPIISALLGVVKGETIPPPTQSSLGLFSPSLGVSLGGVATGLVPASGIIGETVTVKVQGSELQGVTAVQLMPDNGITVGAPTVAADGRSLTVPVTIATDAPQTMRTVKVLAGTTLIPFSNPAAALFRVTPPQPQIDSISPIVLQIGQPPVTFTLRGVNFQNAQQVKVVPPDGVTTTAPAVNAGGTELTVNISAAASATPGSRAVVVVTPAGETSSTASPSNTITLSSNAGTTYTPIISSLLGVLKQELAPPPTTKEIGPILSPLLGVVLQSTPAPPPATTITPVISANTGVVLGTAATGIAPTGIVRGSSGTLTITGVALSGVTSVALSPPDGITLGALTISPDGLQVSVPITVAANASAVVREVVVTAGSSRVAFSDPNANRLGIGAGVPQLDSITPILGNQGTKHMLTVRGSNFQGATAVTATPPAGITFGSTLAVNSIGTELTIDLVIAPDAPLGSRVIRVHVPGASSTAEAAPANTFTVYPP